MAKIIGGTTSTTMRIPDRSWVQINEGNDTLSENATMFEFQVDKPYTELYIEGAIVISATEGTKETIYMRVCERTSPISIGGALSNTVNGDKINYRAHGTISPSGNCVFVGATGRNVYNTSTNIAVNTGSTRVVEGGSFNGLTLNVMTSSPGKFLIGAGSVIKVWGR